MGWSLFLGITCVIKSKISYKIHMKMSIGCIINETNEMESEWLVHTLFPF